MAPNACSAVSTTCSASFSDRPVGAANAAEGDLDGHLVHALSNLAQPLSGSPTPKSVLPSALPRVVGDPTLLPAVLENLIVMH